MLLNQRLQSVLEETKEISRTELMLYSATGKVVAFTCEPEAGIERAVDCFAQSMAESQMASGYHFFKIMIENEPEYILLVKANNEESYMVGRLVSCQIRNIVDTHREQFDRNSFIQNILLGNMPVTDMYNRAKKLHIDITEWSVFVIEVSGKKDDILMETIKNLFAFTSKDFVTETDEKCVVLVKDVSGMKTEEDIAAYARMIADNLQTEAMVKVRVAFGNRAIQLQDISKVYQEARTALEIGAIFNVEKDVISYTKLGIGRLIYQLPKELCEMFLHEVFGDEIPDIFDEETTITISKFFENNLNVSETARQLYLHRNTLMYRLERIEKALGLDIRKFEDALLFKIALMVMTYMEMNG